MRNIHAGIPAPTVAVIPIILIVLSALCGCADSYESALIDALPQDHFVANLQGNSNTGLWNKRLGFAFGDEKNLFIEVDRTADLTDVRNGDLIVFTQPGSIGLICHPVVACGEGWIKTKGFFNDYADPWLVTRERYAGRVSAVAATYAGPWLSVPNLESPTVAGNRNGKVARGHSIAVRAADTPAR